LRQDLDETLRGKPPERLGNRETRDAELGAQRRLVDRGAGRQLEPDDRIAHHVLHALDGAAAALPIKGWQKGVWTLACHDRHSNMLVRRLPTIKQAPPRARKRPAHRIALSGGKLMSH